MSAYHSTAQHLDYTPTVDTPAGAIVQHAGVVGIVGDNGTGEGIKANELGAIDIWAVVRVPNPDGVTFTNGAPVGYVAASDKVIAGGAGDFDIGTAVGAVAATDSIAPVLLNGIDKTAP